MPILQLAQFNDGDDYVDVEVTTRSQDYDDWKHDPGERARRIVGWWRIMNEAKKSKIQSLHKALTLILVVQTSSCSVERLFSQLQYIRRACGHAMLEATLEVRTMMRHQIGKGYDYGD